MELLEASDQMLLEQMAAGSEPAFTTLYRRHQGRVYRFAYGMCGSAALAEDVTQEVFLALLHRPREYHARRGPLEAYLVGIARNQTLRALKKERAFAPLPELEIADVEAGSREMVEAVRKAVLSLPADYREVVVLCELEGLEYAEAAVALGCPIGTVRSRLHRARALLLDKLTARNLGNLV
jgi:RNA polymerase sigma-70 factor (ECF subfamily)